MIHFIIKLIYIFFTIIIITLYHSRINISKLVWNIKYQSYLTENFYKYKRGYTFYDNVHLGVLFSIY